MFPKVMQLLSDPNIWIGDTGASVDMIPASEGLTNTRPCGISVHVGNNEHTAANHSGSLSVTVCDNSGLELYKVSFPDMHLVPQAPYNIISITQRMESGWELSGDKMRGIVLSKNGVEMCFDISVETAKGVLWAACMKRSSPECVAVAPAVMLPLSVEQAHFRLGHMSEKATRKTAEAIGWKLMAGSMAPCESCAIGKGRQKNVTKDDGGPVAKLKQSRVYLDCSSFKESDSNKVIGVWRIMVLYPSQLKMTEIYKIKECAG
jgi:hypothetical protein